VSITARYKNYVKAYHQNYIRSFNSGSPCPVLLLIWKARKNRELPKFSMKASCPLIQADSTRTDKTESKETARVKTGRFVARPKKHRGHVKKKKVTQPAGSNLQEQQVYNHKVLVFIC
jgi:hypothetical protein